MSYFKSKPVFASFVFLSSTIAFAQEKPLASLTMGGIEGKLGLELRTEMTHSNDGLNKGKEDKSTKFDITRARIYTSGKISDTLSYRTNYDVQYSFLDSATVTWTPNPIGRYTIGKFFVNQGGLSNKMPPVPTVSYGHYFPNHLPFPTVTQSGVQATFNMMGTITVQALADVKKDATSSNFYKANAWSKKEKQPAVTAEYLGNFAGIMPLVQIGRYDMNHSMYTNAGVKVVMGKTEAFVEMINDSRQVKITDPSNPRKSKGVSGTLSAVSVMAAHTIENVMRASFFFQNFDNKQPVEKAANLVDHKGNANPTTAGAYAFDDNGSLWTLTYYHLGLASGIEPFVALVGTSGKWYDAKDTTTDLSKKKTETRSELAIKVGIAALL